MILPSEYRCQCGAVVYVGNKVCPRCRAANQHVGFLASDEERVGATKTYQAGGVDKARLKVRDFPEVKPA